MYSFHGGCSGCTLQDDDLSACVGCRYLEHDWALPDKNPVSALAEVSRAEMVAKVYEAHRSSKPMICDGCKDAVLFETAGTRRTCKICGNALLVESVDSDKHEAIIETHSQKFTVTWD